MDSFVVKKSQVVHAMNDNNGSSIATDYPERLNRYRYAFRNEAHLYREEGIKGIVYYFAKCGWNLLRILWKAPNHRILRVKIILSSMIKGFLFYPLPIEKL